MSDHRAGDPMTTVVARFNYRLIMRQQVAARARELLTAAGLEGVLASG